MATFVLQSPGVAISETDNSGYSTTAPTGNTVALIGYAEKGPFTPTLIGSISDFNNNFGYTLMEMPYLAQSVYKYFTQGTSVLVVRAGDDRDPTLYPQAAQYASKQIRLNPHQTQPTSGKQTFSRSSPLGAGTYAINTQFGATITADQFAFPTMKTIETWNVVTQELANGTGASSPVLALSNQVLKLAYSNAGDTTLSVNYQYVVGGTATEEKHGTGTRAGQVLGSGFSTEVTKYATNGTFANDPMNLWDFNGTYGAVALGNTNLKGGFDFSAANETLLLTIGASTYSLNLTEECLTASDIVAALTTALQNASSGGAGTDLSHDIQAFSVVVDAAGTTYVGLRHVAAVAVLANAFNIQSSTAAVTLGLTPQLYSDSSYISGTWNAENPNVVGGTYSGIMILTQTGLVSGVNTFEEPFNITITSPGAGAWTLSNVAQQIQTAINAGYAGYPNKTVRATAAIDSATGKILISTSQPTANASVGLVSITSSNANSLITLLNGVDTAVLGAPASSVGDALITLQAKQQGTYGNNLVLNVKTQTVATGPTTSVGYSNVTVLWNGNTVSTYPKVVWGDPTSASFVSTLMASDPYLAFTDEDEDGVSTMATLPDGNWTLGDGNLPNGVSSLTASIVSYTTGSNGWETDTNGNITSLDSDFATAAQQIYNPETYLFNLVSAPGGSSIGVKLAIQALCEYRHDCFGVLDGAAFGFGLGVGQQINSIIDINTNNNSLTSSYVGIYWAWCKDLDADNNRYVWLPPSIYALQQIAYNDNVAQPWFAPAGLTRGMVSAIDVEYSPSETDRDLIYGGTNVINPLVKFLNQGIAIWGQKTAQRTLTATNRINVRRLMIYAEVLIAEMARSFLFEQNDSTNWSSFARQANSILEPIRQKQGLSTYQVTCDATTNPASLTEQNIMAGVITLTPISTIEGIEVGFTIDAAGAVTITE